MFQYENKIKTDYSNATVVEEYCEEAEEWISWSDDETGIDDIYEYFAERESGGNLVSGISVNINGVKYSYEEAERLGLLPKKVVEAPVMEEKDDIEIIIDDDTKSFRLAVNDNEPVDIPKGLLVDVFEVSGFVSIRDIIEDDGVDDDVLEYLAKSLKMIPDKEEL